MIGNTAGRQQLITIAEGRDSAVAAGCSTLIWRDHATSIIANHRSLYRVLVVIRHSVFIVVINASTTITYYRAWLSASPSITCYRYTDEPYDRAINAITRDTAVIHGPSK